MKKLLVLLSAATVLLASCASGNAPDKKTELKQEFNRPTVVDHKGVAFGLEQPAWVADVLVNSTNQRAMAKALGLNNDKIWVVYGQGPNLEFLRTWIDQVDARAEIASGIQQTIRDSVNAVQEGNKQGNSAEVTEAVKRISERLTLVTVSNLEKAQDWWTKTRQLKIGGDKNNAADYTELYTYLVVYTMDMDSFKKQMNDALTTVLDGTGTEMSNQIRQLALDKMVDEAGVKPKEPSASTSGSGAAFTIEG